MVFMWKDYSAKKIWTGKRGKHSLLHLEFLCNQKNHQTRNGFWTNTTYQGPLRHAVWQDFTVVNDATILYCMALCII